MRLPAMLTILALLALVLPAQGAEKELRLSRGISATLATPEGDGPFPAVLMLHGLGSTRSEIGNIYVDTAEALAAGGIASLRFDFRGFGISGGDIGDFTLERQNEDALIALDALRALPRIDPHRIGLLGFSFGAGAAIELAAARSDEVASLVVWSPVGDYRADMLDSLGQRAFDRAAEDGIVGIDLGWRTMALKRGFFDSLARHDLYAALARYDGPLMIVNGADDFYRAYAGPLLEAAASTDKTAVLIEGADHIYHVYTPSRSTAPQLIDLTVARFQDALAAP